MDDLAYGYKPNTNQLDFVSDNVAASNYTEDIDGQAAGNYQYDAIGNLTSDVTGKISNISWTVYGKIAAITKTDGSIIRYTYYASGNRICKTANGVETWYVRDATGNTMAVYTKTATATLTQYMYMAAVV